MPTTILKFFSSTLSRETISWSVRIFGIPTTRTINNPLMFYVILLLLLFLLLWGHAAECLMPKGLCWKCCINIHENYWKLLEGAWGNWLPPLKTCRKRLRRKRRRSGFAETIWPYISAQCVHVFLDLLNEARSTTCHCTSQSRGLNRRRSLSLTWKLVEA